MLEIYFKALEPKPNMDMWSKNIFMQYISMHGLFNSHSDVHVAPPHLLVCHLAESWGIQLTMAPFHGPLEQEVRRKPGATEIYEKNFK